jgi:hypothetical protein
MLQKIPVRFQRLTIARGGSMRHARDMNDANHGSDLERPAWPFDDGQWRAVVDSLPPESGKALLREIVRVIRKFAADTETDDHRERLRGDAKGDAHSEVKRIRDRIVSLIVAIESLSPAAREYLDIVRIASRPRASLEQLQDHLGDTLSTYRMRSMLPGEAENRGPPVRNARLVELRESLGHIFEQALGGAGQQRGFPAFLHACVAPLGLGVPLSFDAVYRDLDPDRRRSFQKAWNDIRRAEQRAAKRRKCAPAALSPHPDVYGARSSGTSP